MRKLFMIIAVVGVMVASLLVVVAAGAAPASQGATATPGTLPTTGGASQAVTSTPGTLPTTGGAGQVVTGTVTGTPGTLPTTGNTSAIVSLWMLIAVGVAVMLIGLALSRRLS